VARGLGPDAFTHAWRGMGDASTNAIGVEPFGLIFGLGFVLSFGYWCTDFLVVQRAMVAGNMRDAQRTPIIAAFPKLLMPIIVIAPGLIALALTKSGDAYQLPMKLDGRVDYDMTLPTLLAHFYPSGLLGVGLSVVIAPAPVVRPEGPALPPEKPAVRPEGTAAEPDEPAVVEPERPAAVAQPEGAVVEPDGPTAVVEPEGSVVVGPEGPAPGPSVVADPLVDPEWQRVTRRYAIATRVLAGLAGVNFVGFAVARTFKLYRDRPLDPAPGGN
jgi:hypothetical protein